MPGIKTLSRSLNNGLQSRINNDIIKLMVIVDESHLDMLDELLHKDRWGVQVIYVITDSPVVNQCFTRIRGSTLF